jgi:hypothetical protein
MEVSPTVDVIVVARIIIGWCLVARGVAALVLRGWAVKSALVTLGILIVALLSPFTKRCGKILI